MKFINFAVFILMLSVTFAYADDNMTAANDNSTIADDNSTNKTSKTSIKIPAKLVPDRKINDKNQFMRSFGFPAREELKFDVNLSAKDKGLYDDVTLSMTNRWSNKNIWGKDKLYIEGAVYGGMFGFSYFSVINIDAYNPMPIIPYGAVHLKFMSGSKFSPELKVYDSRFQFLKPDINLGEIPQSYNHYYLKLPLGFSIPFFGYKSKIYIDGSYSSLHNNFQVLRPFMVKGSMLSIGDKFSVTSTGWNVRLYADTPVVTKPSISEYAYFGIYYDENTSPRTSSPGSDYNGYSRMVLNTLARSGGIFYEMQLDLYKGLLFGIAANIGYGDIEVKQDTASYNVEYDNTKGLIAYKVRLNLGYEYIFKKHHVGIAFNAGAEYGGYIPFFFAKQENLYSLRLDGDLKYFVELKFLFGY